MNCLWGSHWTPHRSYRSRQGLMTFSLPPVILLLFINAEFTVKHTEFGRNYSRYEQCIHFARLSNIPATCKLCDQVSLPDYAHVVSHLGIFWVLINKFLATGTEGWTLCDNDKCAIPITSSDSKLLNFRQILLEPFGSSTLTDTSCVC